MIIKASPTVITITKRNYTQSKGLTSLCTQYLRKYPSVFFLEVQRQHNRTFCISWFYFWAFQENESPECQTVKVTLFCRIYSAASTRCEKDTSSFIFFLVTAFLEAKQLHFWSCNIWDWVENKIMVWFILCSFEFATV